jgi:hypothetical protein
LSRRGLMTWFPRVRRSQFRRVASARSSVRRWVVGLPIRRGRRAAWRGANRHRAPASPSAPTSVCLGGGAWPPARCPSGPRLRTGCPGLCWPGVLSLLWMQRWRSRASGAPVSRCIRCTRSPVHPVHPFPRASGALVSGVAPAGVPALLGAAVSGELCGRVRCGRGRRLGHALRMSVGDPGPMQRLAFRLRARRVSRR